jgi:hypothetical protein
MQDKVLMYAVGKQAFGDFRFILSKPCGKNEKTSASSPFR